MHIKDYWNQRAFSDIEHATTNDIFLRVLERTVLSRELHQLGCGPESKLLDFGCGDGLTALHVSKELGCHVLGVDYSPAMIELARKRLSDVGENGRVEFLLGDVTDASRLLVNCQFDFVITDRCLINLETAEEQFRSIQGIAQLVKTDGYYLAIENFEEGQEQLNQMRELFELPPIEVRWHNRYFREEEFRVEAERYFRDVRKLCFSSTYYLATRVIYSKLCQLQGVDPDYSHPIHEFSTKLPHVGDFSPIKLFVMRK